MPTGDNQRGAHDEGPRERRIGRQRLEYGVAVHAAPGMRNRGAV